MRSPPLRRAPTRSPGACGTADRCPRPWREIVADYQPILDLRTMEVVGVRPSPGGALLRARWQRPMTSSRSPASSVSTAPSWIARSSRLDATSAAGPARERGWWVSVNLSVEDCTDPTLPGRLEAVLADTALDPDRLVLEVSERAVPVAEVERSLGTLAEIGVRLAIDDFGSGWSSLAQLRSLPISLLKLDRSLVSQPTTADAQLTLATVAMAQALGMETLAEGVEEGEDLLLLCLAECNYGQGFWWSDAQPLDVVLDRFPPLTDPMELYAPVFDLHALRKEFDQSDGWPSDEGILDELESELRALREDDASTIEMPDAMDDEVSHVDAGDPCTSGNDEVESVDVGARSTSPATVSPAAQPWDEGEVDAPARRGTAASQPGAVERELIAALRDRGDDAGTDCPPIVEHVATEPLRDDAWLDLSDDDFLDRLRSRTAAVGSPTGPELAP
ncbi:MAG: EAL domain-containing protein [Acidimicrobiales bacterium]